MSGPVADLMAELSSGILHIPMTLLGAVALLIVSAFLVERVVRLRRADSAGRVSLIAPWTPARAGMPMRTAETIDEVLRGPKLSAGEREVARRLTRLGIPARLAPALLQAAQVFGASSLAIGLWFLEPQLMTPLLSLRLAVAMGAGLLGWFLPVFLSNWAAKRRAAIVVAGLPDALELLVICAEGGLALGDGIDRIVNELQRSQPELAEELAMTAADLKILPSQDQALSRLAARIDAPIVQSVVTTLTQSMRYGTPFAQAMRVVAAEIRDEALFRLEERANKLPVLLTVPMIVFILPTIFLVVGGPAALALLDQLGR